MELTLTEVEVSKAKAGGKGPTFRPVSRNRMKCNQLPGLGHLTRHQAEWVKNVCWPRARVATKSKPVVPPPAKPKPAAPRGFPYYSGYYYD